MFPAEDKTRETAPSLYNNIKDLPLNEAEVSKAGMQELLDNAMNRSVNHDEAKQFQGHMLIEMAGNRPGL